MKKTINLILSVILACLLCACGNQKEMKIANEYSKLNDEISVIQPMPETETKTVIPSHLTYDVVSKSGKSKVKVDADVVTYGLDAAGVYDAEYVKIDDDYLKSLAERLFDDGDYTVRKPYLICNVDELKAEEERLGEYTVPEDKYITGLSEAIWEVRYLLEMDEETINNRAFDMKAGEVIVSLTHSGIYYMPGEGLLQHTGIYYSTEESNGEPREMNYRSAILQGYISGREYQLYYIESPIGTNLKLRLIEPQGSASLLCDMDCTLFDDLFGENICDLDTARSVASEMIARLGYVDYEESTVAKVRCNGEEEGSLYLDGYYFYYAPTINGVSSQVCDNENIISVSDRDNGIRNYTEKESICVKVDHTGLIGINFGSHYNIGSKLADQTELMEFSKIEEIANNRMIDIMAVQENSFNYLMSDYLTQRWTMADAVKQIKFDYLPVRYDGKYVFIPAWLFICVSEDVGDMTVFSNPYCKVAVNALDGSLMQLDYVPKEYLTSYWYEPERNY